MWETGKFQLMSGAHDCHSFTETKRDSYGRQISLDKRHGEHKRGLARKGGSGKLRVAKDTGLLNAQNSSWWILGNSATTEMTGC